MLGHLNSTKNHSYIQLFNYQVKLHPHPAQSTTPEATPFQRTSVGSNKTIQLMVAFIGVSFLFFYSFSEFSVAKAALDELYQLFIVVGG